MILKIVEKSFGTLLRELRESTPDPTTGRPYTQKRVEELLGFSDAALSNYENGKARPQVEQVNALAKLYRTPVLRLVEALGFEVEPMALTEDEREWLAVYRRIAPPLRPGAMRLAQTLPDLHEPSAPTPRRSARPR